MKYRIVNLSAVQTVRPIQHCINEFAELCEDYSSSIFFGCCPSFFRNWISHPAWVRAKYIANMSTLINPYKTGALSTEQFLKGMLNIFYFLQPDRITLPDEVKQEIEQTKESLYTCAGRRTLKPEDYSFALLERAWNAIVDYTEADAKRLEHLIKDNNSNIYLISNTNVLNIHKILQKMRKLHPQVRWYDNVDITKASDAETASIALAPNIYLCPSYLAHTFKSSKDNQQDANLRSTPTLLHNLLKALKVNVQRDVDVISQYPKDLTEAKAQGVLPQNLHAAAEFFPDAHKPFKAVV